MGESKPRRRGEQLERAILEAAWEELNEVGYAGVTIEAVAARAGTSKPVIYRRWANRAELVLAAWGRQSPMRPDFKDTGTLRGDLMALFGAIAHRADRMMGSMIAGVMGETFRHPEMAALLQERLKSPPMVQVIQKIIDRAVARGELAPVTVSPRAGRVPLDLIRNESMLCRTPVPDSTIAELVDEVYLPLLRGLQPNN
ncbi:TetR/AcrR family transcriptional regulator [Actinophytocola xanthii]|uniref:TetR family transcriptional regulator n=1 Tax=Actinophytocola xanthii TaxID=1912961 RepID=A0A1Q8CSW3_9PSEU|nr:TetR/AcrR family transcriptional regulator [Actinophytocola xanthii]OLF17436.1 TetR family transcriptional regulator [Actinophytocola xanthii]